VKAEGYMLSFSIQLISLALILLQIGGCAMFDSALSGNRFATRYNAPYTQSDLDELLSFGANMANLPASSRVKVCRLLLKRQNEPEPGIQLHLMIGRLLTDACGEIPKILDRVASIPAAKLFDQRVQRLVSIHMETLKRMKNVSRRAGTWKGQQKPFQPALESNDSKESKSDENHLLREKLEAIRSMEKQLDESGDGK
jgi:hypothetical protein